MCQMKVYDKIIPNSELQKLLNMPRYKTIILVGGDVWPMHDSVGHVRLVYLKESSRAVKRFINCMAFYYCPIPSPTITWKVKVLIKYLLI